MKDTLSGSLKWPLYTGLTVQPSQEYIGFRLTTLWWYALIASKVDVTPNYYRIKAIVICIQRSFTVIYTEDI